MKTPALPVRTAMADFAGGPDLVMACKCGTPMRPEDMRRIPAGPGNRGVLERIGCPTCYWAAIGPFGGPTS